MAAEEVRVIAVIAQKAGFYGCAFFTTESTVDAVKQAIISAGATYADVMINPFLGQPQPEPVLLFDTGSGNEDLELLRRIRKYL